MGTQAINYIPQAVLIVACALAAISDWRTRRIPNSISIALAVVAILFQLRHGFLAMLLAVAIGLGVLFCGLGLFVIRWMGGGDIKLMAAGAMIAGPSDALHFIFYSFMAGGVLAVIALIARKQFSVVPSILLRVNFAARNPDGLMAKARTGIVLPYAIAIAVGAMAATFYNHLPTALRIT